ncbi:MAG: hypothetical protein ABIQ95_02100 [Bdellovibrionia bacterium]
MLLNSIGSGKKLPSDPTELAWDNIRRNVARIQKESLLIRTRVQEKRFKVVGAIYDLAKGIVTFDTTLKTPKIKRENYK